MHRRLLSTLLATCSALAACGSDGAMVGYDGPIPSAEARRLVRELEGEPIAQTDAAFGPGTWIVGPFGVVPNPRTGKSPVVQVHSSEARDWIPLLSDGDVADLVRRVRGSAPEDHAGELSEAYADVWK